MLHHEVSMIPRTDEKMDLTYSARAATASRAVAGASARSARTASHFDFCVWLLGWKVSVSVVVDCDVDCADRWSLRMENEQETERGLYSRCSAELAGDLQELPLRGGESGDATLQVCYGRAG